MHSDGTSSWGTKGDTGKREHSSETVSSETQTESTAAGGWPWRPSKARPFLYRAPGGVSPPGISPGVSLARTSSAYLNIRWVPIGEASGTGTCPAAADTCWRRTRVGGHVLAGTCLAVDIVGGHVFGGHVFGSGHVYGGHVLAESGQAGAGKWCNGRAPPPPRPGHSAPTAAVTAAPARRPRPARRPGRNPRARPGNSGQGSGREGDGVVIQARLERDGMRGGVDSGCSISFGWRRPRLAGGAAAGAGAKGKGPRAKGPRAVLVEVVVTGPSSVVEQEVEDGATKETAYKVEEETQLKRQHTRWRTAQLKRQHARWRRRRN